MEENKKKRDYLLPASILISALLVSISLVYSAGKSQSDEKLKANLSGTVNDQKPAQINIRPVSENDHILGSFDAPLKVVEFSDLECPFCKRFHVTMKEIIEAYGGKVAWVYRHFPIDTLHSKARKEAEASECANEIGGNNKFWAYIDKLFEITPSNNGLDLNELPKIATTVGLDKAKFEACLSSGKYANKIETDVQDADASLARGTPYSVVIGRDGKNYVINGALPFESVKAIIDQALKGQ